MRIALVTHSFNPYSFGGREKHVYSLAKNLSKEHDVGVFTCSNSLFDFHIKKEGRLKIYFLRTINVPIKGTKYRIPIGLLNSLAKFNPDVIHAHDIHHLTSPISCFYARLSHKNFVLTEHGYPEQKGALRIVMKAYEKLFLKFLTENSKTIAVSNFIKDELEERYRVVGKIAVVYNWVDLEEYEKKSEDFLNMYNLRNKKIILAVGRLTEDKGFNHLIKAFKIVSKKIKNINLVIIGGGRLRNTLEEIAEKEKIKNNVIFTGNITEDMLKSAIYCSDIFVIPSLYEPFGIVALEAMSYKKPMVASFTGGLKEFLKDGENCLFFTPANERELAMFIQKLLKNRELARKLSDESEKTVQEFKSEPAIKKVTEIYNNS